MIYVREEGMFYTLGFEFFESLGGNHFTKILTEYFMGEFFKKFKLDAKENRRLVEKLKLASERCTFTFFQPLLQLIVTLSHFKMGWMFH